VHFRFAEKKDSAFITRVINSAFRRAESFFIDRDRIDETTVLKLMQTGQFLTAAQNDEILGCVYLEARGERSYLGLLSVDPSRQRSGLGSMLMDAAEKQCRENGYKFMDLQIVNLRKELPDFYRRRGYVETGTAPFTLDIPTRIPCHFIKMSKPLGNDVEN